MQIPALTEEGWLPLGRFGCTLDTLETAFVDDPAFVDSETRGDIFSDLLSVIELFSAFSTTLIESIWIGGSFVTAKRDPDDIDCLFILSSEAYNALPSNRKRQQVKQLGKKDYVREKYGLRVESFVLIRTVIAMPWERDGVTREAASYTEIRGAWDDWWLRTRTTEGPEDEPLPESAHPRRGYLEVRP